MESVSDTYTYYIVSDIDLERRIRFDLCFHMDRNNSQYISYSQDVGVEYVWVMQLRVVYN
jgi:hypothetical protein